MRIREDQADEVIIITPSLLRKRSWYQLLQVVCKVLLLLPRRMDLLSQHLTNKGMLYNTDLPEVSVEAEWHALQDKGISGTAFRTSLAASCDTTQAVYYGTWESFVNWCPGTNSSRWHARSLSCSHAEWIACCSTCPTRACSTTLTCLRLAWKLSSMPSKTRVFQEQLSEQVLLLPATPLKRCTMAHGRALSAGVTERVRIPFARP